MVLDPDRERAGRLAAEVAERVAVVEGDSADDDAVMRAIAVARELGSFRVAVSATGAVIPSRPLLDTHGEMLAVSTLIENLQLHVVGPFNLARHSAASAG